jgi:hypothetical protein
MLRGRTVAVTTMFVSLISSLPQAREGVADSPGAGTGACGKVNGLSLTTAPTSKLCAAGKSSAVTGTGPWTWSCTGTQTSTAAYCEADQALRLCASGTSVARCASTATVVGAGWIPAFLPFRSVYFHTVQGSFWANLANDTGPSPTPRELAIKSIHQNFAAIKALGFDAVAFSLPDSDGWPSGHGGGFSYDPGNPAAAQPQFAVAQEIAVRVADANHLKVIFSIGLSPYRFSSDGRP